MPKKKGKKAVSKKSKKTSSTKASIADIYRPPPCTPEECLHEGLRRTRWWLQEDSAIIQTYFERRGHEDISVEDCIATLRHLQAPLSSEQTNLLLRYLDPAHSGTITVKFLTDIAEKTDQDLLKIAYTTSLMDPPPPPETDGGVSKKKKKKEKKEIDVAKDTKGAGALEPQDEYKPRYVELQLTLATFKDLHQHPGHFTVILTNSVSIHGLIDIIKNHLSHVALTIAVFTEPSCTQESFLNPSWTLESCGMEGSEVKYDPRRYHLYYDYIPDFIDCPLLMADNAMRDCSPITVKKIGNLKQH